MQKNVLKKLFTSHKWDLLLGTALLLIALCLFLVFGKTKKEGSYVQVKQNNKITGVYPLDKDASYEFSNFFGSNTLVIKEGKAYVINSNCPDKTCEHMGKIYRNGEMIICLPHELIIEVINSKEVNYDAISE